MACGSPAQTSKARYRAETQRAPGREFAKWSLPDRTCSWTSCPRQRRQVDRKPCASSTRSNRSGHRIRRAPLHNSRSPRASAMCPQIDYYLDYTPYGRKTPRAGGLAALRVVQDPDCTATLSRSGSSRNDHDPSGAVALNVNDHARLPVKTSSKLRPIGRGQSAWVSDVQVTMTAVNGCRPRPGPDHAVIPRVKNVRRGVGQGRGRQDHDQRQSGRRPVPDRRASRSCWTESTAPTSRS